MEWKSGAHTSQPECSTLNGREDESAHTIPAGRWKKTKEGNFPGEVLPASCLGGVVLWVVLSLRIGLKSTEPQQM